MERECFQGKALTSSSDSSWSCSVCSIPSNGSRLCCHSCVLNICHSCSACNRPAFYQAVKLGNLVGVKHLLEIKADINVIERMSKSSPLHAASFYERPNVLEFLLSKGALTNLVNIHGLRAEEEAKGECRKVWRLFRSKQGPHEEVKKMSEKAQTAYKMWGTFIQRVYEKASPTVQYYLPLMASSPKMFEGSLEMAAELKGDPVAFTEWAQIKAEQYENVVAGSLNVLPITAFNALPKSTIQIIHGSTTSVESIEDELQLNVDSGLYELLRESKVPEIISAFDTEKEGFYDTYKKAQKVEKVEDNKDDIKAEITSKSKASLSRENFLAIYLYTIDKPKIYEIINREILQTITDGEKEAKTRAQMRLRDWRNFLERLFVGICQLPSSTTIVYKSFSSVREKLLDYKKGDTFVWGFFASTTEKKKYFHWGKYDVFSTIELPLGYGGAIGPYSCFKSESEVLLPGFSTFQLLDIEEVGEQQDVIKDETNKEKPKYLVRLRCLGLSEQNSKE